jgi:hypothetical protein
MVRAAARGAAGMEPVERDNLDVRPPTGRGWTFQTEAAPAGGPPRQERRWT